MANNFEIGFRENYTYESAQDIGNVKVAQENSGNFSFTNGTGDNSVDTIYKDKLQLRTGNAWTVSYDLTALTDAFGVSKNFSKVKFLRILNASDGTTLTADIACLEDVTNAFKAFLADVIGDEISLSPLDILQASKRKTGWTVDATHKVISITSGLATSSADDADIEITIIGVAT